jgi:hypothetical protein
MRSRGVDKWEVQGQLGHRGGVTERYAEYAPDYQAKATAAIESFWNKIGGDSSGTVPWTMSAKYLILLVPVERIELPTFGLQNRCSTAELNRQTL